MTCVRAIQDKLDKRSGNIITSGQHTHCCRRTRFASSARFFSRASFLARSSCTHPTHPVAPGHGCCPHTQPTKQAASHVQRACGPLHDYQARPHASACEVDSAATTGHASQAVWPVYATTAAQTPYLVFDFIDSFALQGGRSRLLPIFLVLVLLLQHPTAKRTPNEQCARTPHKPSSPQRFTCDALVYVAVFGTGPLGSATFPSSFPWLSHVWWCSGAVASGAHNFVCFVCFVVLLFCCFVVLLFCCFVCFVPFASNIWLLPPVGIACLGAVGLRRSIGISRGALVRGQPMFAPQLLRCVESGGDTKRSIGSVVPGTQDMQARQLLRNISPHGSHS